MEVLNPATGEMIAEVPRGTQADVDRAVEAAKNALPEWLDTTPGERAEACCLQARRRGRGARRGARAGSSRRTSASRCPSPGTRRRSASDNLRFFAGAARCLEGSAAGEYMRGLHVDDPPRAGRRRRPDRALELPADDGHLEDRPRARGRERQVLKPSEQTPLTTLLLRRATRRSLPAGRLQRDHGRRRAGRRRHRAPSGRPHGLAHRRRRRPARRSRGPRPTR